MDKGALVQLVVTEGVKIRIELKALRDDQTIWTVFLYSNQGNLPS